MSVKSMVTLAAALSGVVAGPATATPAKEPEAMHTAPHDRFVEMEAFATHVREVMFSANPRLIAELLDPSFSVWQNTDGYVFSGPTIDRFHQQLKQSLKSLQFLDRTITPTEAGYIDQHVKRMVTLEGVEYLVPCVMVMSVRNSRLTGAREYMDSAHIPPIVKKLRDALAAEVKATAPQP